MSYYQPELYSRGWTSVEDIEKSLVSASRITQDSDGAQRVSVPPIPVPLDPQNVLPPDPFSMLNHRHTIIGRGQMILEKKMACNVGFRDQRISRELGKGVPGLRGYSDSAAQEIISSSGQFDDCDEVHPDEPSFESLKVTSTPSSSAIKEARTLSPANPSRVGLDFSDDPQDVMDPNGIDSASSIQPNFSAGHLDSSSGRQETSSGAHISYSDAFFYSFDDSVYVKIEDPTVFPTATEALTPSPCSSPLPDHSTLEGHYDRCVQVESDSSSSSSSIFDLLANKDAVDFTTRLRATLPDDYHDVMSVWKDYQAGQISYSALELQIARLLGPYPDLMDAFFKFTSLSLSEESESLIVESVNGEIPDVLEAADQPDSGFLPTTGESSGEAIDQNPTNFVETASLLPKIDHPVGPKIRTDMFDDCIKFCRLVKNEFAAQPDVFTKFLALLNDHNAAKIDKKSMIDGATRLFQFHRELVQDFEKLTAENFSSMLFKTAGSVAAHSALKKVGRLTDSTRPRRCRNALILNLLKKEQASSEEPVIPAEGVPTMVVGDGVLQENNVKDQTGIFIGKTCDVNGNSHVGESVSVLNDLGNPNSTILGYNSAEVDIGVVSSTVFDDVDNRHYEPCRLDSVQDVNLVQTGHSYDLTTASLNAEVTDFSDLQLSDLASSLPLGPIDQDKPLELLKPEDIIPDKNAEVPHMPFSLVMDTIVVQDIMGEVASFENDAGNSELLKPEDIITELGTLETADELVTPAMETIIQDLVEDLVVGPVECDSGSSDLLKPDDIITELGNLETAVELVAPVENTVAIQDVVGELEVAPVESNVRTSDRCDVPEIELLKPSDFVHLEPIVVEAKETLTALDLPVVTPAMPSTITLDAPENLFVEETDGESALSVSLEVLCSGDETKSVDAVSSSIDIHSSIDAAVISGDNVSSSDDGNPLSAKTSDVGQEKCCGVDSTSNSVPAFEVVEDNPMNDTEQVLDTVVVALAKMDLNSDFKDSMPPEEVAELDSSSDTIFADAVPLPDSSGESSDCNVVDDITGTEVTMTVQIVPDVNTSLDHVPVSITQVTPDSRSLLFSPDHVPGSIPQVIPDSRSLQLSPDHAPGSVCQVTPDSGSLLFSPDHVPGSIPQVIPDSRSLQLSPDHVPGSVCQVTPDSGSLLLSRDHVPGSITQVTPDSGPLLLSPDHVPGSIPQVTPDSGPLLLSPDHVPGSITQVTPDSGPLLLSPDHVPGSIPQVTPDSGPLLLSPDHVPGSVPQVTPDSGSLLLSPDHVPGSVPQVTPDSGPLLLRPDQFVTLSTAVDPLQVQQALEKTLPGSRP